MCETWGLEMETLTEEKAPSKKTACALWEHREVWSLVHTNPLCWLSAWFLGSSKHMVDSSSIVVMETPQWDAYSETSYKWRVNSREERVLGFPRDPLRPLVHASHIHLPSDLGPQDLCIEPWPLPTTLDICLTYHGASPLVVHSQTWHLHPVTCE